MMNDLTNLSIEFIIWVLRLVLVGLVYLFIWRIMRTMMRGTQHGPIIGDLGAYLIVSDPGKSKLERGHAFMLDIHSTIGRKGTNFVVIDDPLVSESHAMIQFVDDQWVIRDLGSTNKTYLNNLQIVNPVVLSHNDVITIGRTRLRMFIHAENAQQQT